MYAIGIIDTLTDGISVSSSKSSAAIPASVLEIINSSEEIPPDGSVGSGSSSKATRSAHSLIKASKIQARIDGMERENMYNFYSRKSNQTMQKHILGKQ